MEVSFLQAAEVIESLFNAVAIIVFSVLALFALLVIALLLKMSWNQRRLEKALERRGGRRPLDEIVSELQGREYSLVSLWDESITCMKVPEIWIYPQDVGEQWEPEQHASDPKRTAASLKRTIQLFRETWGDRRAWILDPDKDISRSMWPGEKYFSKTLDMIEEQIGYPAVRKLDYGRVDLDLGEWCDEETESG
ncbi:MAG: hypothetical protein KDA77_01380 [Planctomycetaceae bacterium]|nr:hypothetical protein [Planctomycetaceae bacterium]